jgi:hypothetical protein
MPTLPLRAKDVFLQALDVPPAEREAFVAEACGTDARLRAFPPAKCLPAAIE